MKNCDWEERVGRWFDGESSDAAQVESHVAACKGCTAYVADLSLLRDVRTADVPAISDAQFRSFMDGIHEEIAPRPSVWRGFWAMTSLTAAAFVVAFSAFILMRGAPKPVLATEVESISTELDGATVEWYDNDDGVTTVWVNVAVDDLP